MMGKKLEKIKKIGINFYWGGRGGAWGGWCPKAIQNTLLTTKIFSFNSFKSELLSKFHHNNVTFTSFENNFVNELNQQAPK